MKPSLLISLVITLLCINQLTAQIQRLQQRSSGEDESVENPNPTIEAGKSALSPDTAKILWFQPNLNASYTIRPFTAQLHNFQIYNPVAGGKDFFVHLGTSGSAARSLTFTPSVNQNFSFSHSAFDPYKISLDSIKFYIPEKPFSEIKYMMGKSKEQQLLFTHTQQVVKGLTLGVYIRYSNSPGLYQRQRTYYSSGYFTASYLTPSRRYGVFGAYLTDRFRNFENGGIAYDTVFTQNVENNRKTIAINLVNAINRDKTSGILIQQYFTLQKARNPLLDTNQLLDRTRFQAGRLAHTFKYQRVATGYEDNNSFYNSRTGYYPVTYADSTLTLDSTFHVHLENNLVYSNLEPDTSRRDFPFQYTFGIRHCIDRFGYGNIGNLANSILLPYQFSISEYSNLRGETHTYMQWIPFGTLKGIIARKTYFIVDGRISLGGYNVGDHEIKGSLHQYFGAKKSARLYLTLSRAQQHPEYFFYHFVSNHFRWDNSLESQDILKAESGIDLFGYHLALSHSRISNYCWLDEEIKPRQHGGALTITRADFSKVFRPGRWIFDARVSLQDISDTSILQLPQLVAHGSISYSTLLFKKVLFAEAGVHCNYYSKFYADSYMPELRSFYRQSSIITGNYPFLDAFVNMRIKRARIFIMYEHFNAKLMGYNYFLLPHYPAADASFKAGVSWVFYD